MIQKIISEHLQAESTPVLWGTNIITRQQLFGNNIVKCS